MSNPILKLFFWTLMISQSASDGIAQTINKTDSNSTLIEKNSAQGTPKKTIPKLMILPWQTPSIDPDSLQKTKQARQEILNFLKTSLAPNAVTLDTIAPKSPRFESARSNLKDIYADENATDPNPIALFPIWSSIHNYDLLGLVVIDSKQDTVKKVLHKMIPKSLWLNAVRTKKYKEYYQSTFQALVQDLNLRSLPTPNQDIAVTFRDQLASGRINEIDRTILGLMISSEWTSDFSILNPMGRELLTTIHKFYEEETTIRRANREIEIRTAYERSPVKMVLPTTITMNIRGTDGVFGQTLPWSWSEPLTMSVNSNSTLELKYSSRLKSELSGEKTSLKRDELPQVAKIKGAWAYMDKGRAWGLQMNDRLTSNEEPQKIKGHVVAYFGPELKLKSPRGWPIHEGAIVFIRKGQRDIKIGQTLSYDGLKVPTPWPPSPSPTVLK